MGGEQGEKDAKAATKQLKSDADRRNLELASVEHQAENVQKDAVRAFEEAAKKKTATKEKVMKSKLSEIESKVSQDKKDYQKSLNKRELSGKSARELAQKAARAASMQLKALREAKDGATAKLTEARKAKAQVDLIHAM